MRQKARALLQHPIVRSLIFERLLLVAAFLLALTAVATGRVKPAEIPGLLDLRLLSLFFVLTIAVERSPRSPTSSGRSSSPGKAATRKRSGGGFCRSRPPCSSCSSGCRSPSCRE